MFLSDCTVSLSVAIAPVGPYDFHSAENTDGIAEFANKNGINCEMPKCGCDF